MRYTTDLADAVVTAIKTELDLGFIFVFAGAVPDSAEDALNMATTHTELVKLSLNGTATGLTWDAALNGAILKPTADDWEGLNTFDGFDDAVSPKVATFARFCPAGDNGRGAATTPRIQFSVSGPSGTGELILSSTSITDNGVLTTAAAFARIALGLGSA